MTNILKRVLSLGDVRKGKKASTNDKGRNEFEYEDTLVDAQEFEADEMQNIFDFAEMGIQDHMGLRKA